jgi:sulfur-oxidizing protein SoxZ
MVQQSIRVKAKRKNDLIEVKSMIQHRMTSTHFITEVRCEQNDNLVFVANWSNTVSQNPYLSFRIKEGRGGDRIKISWQDNQGDSDSAETTVA